jgi:membrane fusion protein, multidrug efflux system
MRLQVLWTALICAHAGPALCETALPVEIVKATAAVREQDIVLAGVLQPEQSFQASFPDGGRVLSVAVRQGDLVAKDSVLAQIDPTQAAAEQRAAQAELDGAEAALLQAKLANDRTQGLLDRGTGTRAEVDAAVEALISARSTRDKAAAQLAKAQSRLNDTTLRASTAGTVIRRSAEPGSVVGPGQEVIAIAAAGGLDAVFNVADGFNLEAFLGDPVSVTFIDSPALTLDATVTEVSPLVDPSTGTVQVKARITGAKPPSVPFGAAVVGHVAIPDPGAIALPWTALTTSATGPAVWTVDPATMTVALTPIEIDSYTSDTVRIKAGVSADMLVVGRGSQLLFPGRQVVAATEVK